MTFRGTPFEAKRPEKRKPNDIFCRWEVVRLDRFRLTFSPQTENFSALPSLRGP
jgi:hypothetical protein